MNIFWLDEDVEKCARYHCDKHVTKMLVEYGQILSTVADKWDFHEPDRMYEPVPTINPVIHDWCAESLQNFIRVYRLACELHNEYQHRYGGTHSTYDKVLSSIEITNATMPDEGFTDPPLCMPETYQVEGDYIRSYRNFYIYGKDWNLSWFNRDVPDWYSGDTRDYEGFDAEA